MGRRKVEPKWTPFEQVPVDGHHERVARIGWEPDPMNQAVAVYVNSRYQVTLFRYPGNYWPGMPLEIVQLSIKRHDKREIKDWRDLQRLKSEIMGPEVEAVELYPAEWRMVDTANQYHLWCLPPDSAFPLGYVDGRIISGPVNPDGSNPSGSRQRPFEEEPEGAMPPGLVEALSTGGGVCSQCGEKGEIDLRTGDAHCNCGSEWNLLAS